jgi:hypothetical protein
MPQATIITKTIEIDIVRSGHIYFMNRRENGTTVVDADRVKREHALEVYQNNTGLGRERSINTVNFDDIRPHEWSWTITLEA